LELLESLVMKKPIPSLHASLLTEKLTIHHNRCCHQSDYEGEVEHVSSTGGSRGSSGSTSSEGEELLTKLLTGFRGGDERGSHPRVQPKSVFREDGETLGVKIHPASVNTSTRLLHILGEDVVTAVSILFRQKFE